MRLQRTWKSFQFCLIEESQLKVVFGAFETFFQTLATRKTKWVDFSEEIQVVLRQKHLFLQQLTQKIISQFVQNYYKKWCNVRGSNSPWMLLKKNNLYKSYPLLICTWFLKVDLKKWSSTKSIFGLHISNLNFAVYTGSKNQVWNRPKIEFIELHFLKSIFEKSSADQQGDICSTTLMIRLIIMRSS